MSELYTDGRRITLFDKSFPARSVGMQVADFLATRPRLAEFSTPLFVLDGIAMANNISVMGQWVASRGLELMPHGKTTMAPALWHAQLAAGATGISLATAWQARVALAHGVPTVQIANSLTDPQGLIDLSTLQDSDDSRDVLCWVDSVAAIDQMEAALVALSTNRPIGVLVELGAEGGRTGARTMDEAMVLVSRILSSPCLEFRGVAGYEGALGHDRSDDALAKVRAYLDSLTHLFVRARGLVDRPGLIISAGGSAYFDLVHEALLPLHDGDARLVLRSGAYITHDDGFYRHISPLTHEADPDAQRTLESAMRGYARVASRPEDSLALLDAGKRDVPFDEGLPVPVAWATTLGGEESPLGNATISAVNDQHAFMRWSGDMPAGVGSVVRLGLSHPCTAFDKWRLVPVVAGDDDLVVDVVETCF